MGGEGHADRHVLNRPATTREYDSTPSTAARGRPCGTQADVRAGRRACGADDRIRATFILLLGLLLALLLAVDRVRVVLLHGGLAGLLRGPADEAGEAGARASRRGTGGRARAAGTRLGLVDAELDALGPSAPCRALPGHG